MRGKFPDCGSLWELEREMLACEHWGARRKGEWDRNGECCRLHSRASDHTLQRNGE